MEEERELQMSKEEEPLEANCSFDKKWNYPTVSVYHLVDYLEHVSSS